MLKYATIEAPTIQDYERPPKCPSPVSLEAKVKRDFGEALRRYFAMKQTNRPNISKDDVPAAPCLPFHLPPVPELKVPAVVPQSLPRVRFPK